MFIAVEDDGALAACNLDRGDFGSEPTLRHGAGGAHLTFQSEGILIGTADAMGCGNVLGGHAHMPGPERAGKRPGHHVDGAGIAHLGAKARSGQRMGRARHAFRPTHERCIGIAQHERLRTRNDGLQAGAAEAVDVHRRGGFRHAGLHCGNARQVHVAWFGVDDMAEDRRADGGGVQSRAGNGFACRRGGKVDGRDGGERSAEGADGGARAGEDVDIGHGLAPLPCFVPQDAMACPFMQR